MGNSGDTSGDVTDASDTFRRVADTPEVSAMATAVSAPLPRLLGALSTLELLLLTSGVINVIPNLSATVGDKSGGVSDTCRIVTDAFRAAADTCGIVGGTFRKRWRHFQKYHRIIF